ncbi:MAG TPA: hypothetical protein VI316_00480 [Candidatus Dormibacteraeota bacterium]
MDAADLYHVPLDEFVAARSALVTRLRSSGDREAAAAAARARKPSLGAWLVDQLAREAPEAIAELLAASADTLETQRSLLTQGPDAGSDVRDASARFAEALGVVRGRARDILEESEHPVSDVTLRRAETTAHAAAVGGAATRHALFRGTLDRDLDPPGFAAIAELEPDAPEVARAIAGLRRARGPSASRRGPDLADASRVSRLRADLRAAEREAMEKRRAADRAVARAARAAERADRLAADALAAREEATTAERAVTPAEEAARSAEALRDAARASLATAEH